MRNVLLPKKSLGQHFLTNPSIAMGMAARIKGDNVQVLEIGPGTGQLTKHLLDCPQVTQVIAVEIDHNAIDYLKQRFAPRIEQGNLVLIHSDIRKIDIKTLKVACLTIVSNLPYNIGTSILMSLLEELDYISQIIIMLQREVANRLAASYNTKIYGKISILLQNMCHVKAIMKVGKNSFWPAPKVLSTVLEITPRADRPSIADFKLMAHLCSIAFNMRRKKLLNCLIKHLKLESKDIEQIIKKLPNIVDTRIEAMQPADILLLSKIIEGYLA